MRIRVISDREGIETINEYEEIVHISFRPSIVDFLNIIKKCKHIKLIQIGKSYINTISKSSFEILELHNIPLVEGDVWGHRSDIDYYYEITPHIVDEIRNLKEEGESDQNILNDMKVRTNLNGDLLEFIIDNVSIRPEQDSV